MKPRFILSIDQGTTSSRAILFDENAQPAGIAQEEFRQIYPQPGWVEHDAMEIWETQSAVIREVMKEAHLSAKDLAGIGITNQRETTVVWDRQTGEPIHHAIVWQDRRTASVCDELRHHEESVTAKTGLRIDPYFSATKIAHILDAVPGARERAEAGELAFGTIDCWLAWKLTEGKSHITDPSNASRTLLFNIHTGEWDDELCEWFGVPKKMLPEVVASSGSLAVATALNEIKDVPIGGIAGDQQAALFGQACFAPGLAKCTYGTGCFLLLNTGSEPISPPPGLLTTVAWKLGNETTYALEGSVFIGGAAIQWLRDELRILDSAPEVNELAESVPDSDGVYLVPAFAGLGAPHWDAEARGSIFGLTRGTNRAHLARATLEGIGFQVNDLVETMESRSNLKLSELRVDGGASRSDPLMQFQSDLLAGDVIRPKIVETTALGAAYLAGLGVGFWADRDELAQHWDEDSRYSPQQDKEHLRPHLENWNRAVEMTRGFGTPAPIDSTDS